MKCKSQQKILLIIQRHDPFANLQLVHQVMRGGKKNQQRKNDLKRENDPLTTQASSAAARSSRPRGASRAQGAGATKIR